jgi:hypothetical protein
MFQCISMCFNVFIDIVIGISPSHSHCNVFAMACTSTYTFFFTLHNDSLPNMLYYYTLFFPFPLICSNLHTIYEKITCQYLFFTSTHHPTFQVPYYMSSLVARSIVKPKLFSSSSLAFPILLYVNENLQLGDRQGVKF